MHNPPQRQRPPRARTSRSTGCSPRRSSGSRRRRCASRSSTCSATSRAARRPTIQAGYDTGPGGSIPTYWKALLGGLTDFFNPLDDRRSTPGRRCRTSTSDPPTAARCRSSAPSTCPADSLDFDLHYDPLPDDIARVARHRRRRHARHLQPQRAREVDLDDHHRPARGRRLEARHPRPHRPAAQRDRRRLPRATRASATSRYRSNRRPRARRRRVHRHHAGARFRRQAARRRRRHRGPAAGDARALGDARPTATCRSTSTRPYSGIGAIQAEVRDYFGADPAVVRVRARPSSSSPATTRSASESLIRARVERIRSRQLRPGRRRRRRHACSVGDGQLPLEVQVVHDDFDGKGTAMDAARRREPAAVGAARSPCAPPTPARPASR